MPKFSRIFRKFLISYIIILLIPSIAGYMSYRTAIAVTQSVSIENNVTQLRKSQDILERRMAEVEGFTRQLALNQELSVLMNEKGMDEKVNLYGIWKVNNDIKAFSQTNDFLQQFYIYLNNYNVLLTPASSYFQPERYYQSFRYKDLPADEWKRTLLEQTHNREVIPLKPFITNGVQTSVITYIQSLPLDSFSGSARATVVVLIDEKVISSLLSDLKDQYGGWSHISDAQGHTLSLLGMNEADAAKLASDNSFDQMKASQFYNDDLVITIRSKTTGWVYRAGIPRHVLMENANKIKYITWSVTSSALVVGLLVGLWQAYRNSTPMHRLLNVMKEQFGKDAAVGRNEYDFLQGNISNMISNNKRLENELNRQLPLIRDAFLKRLIAGEFRSLEEIAAAAEQANTGLEANTGYTSILQIKGYSGMDNVEILNELSAARFIMKQTVQDLGWLVHMTDLGADRVVVIFEGIASAEDTPNQEIERILNELAEYLFAEYKITIIAAMSNPFTTVMEISHTYEQAKQALEYALHMNRKGVIWFSDARLESDTYYYPLDIELRFISTIRAGDLEEARRILDAIIAQNIENRELSIEMKHQLVGELKGTFLKLLYQKTFQESEIYEVVKNRVTDIQANEEMDAIRQDIDEIMASLCGLIATKKNDHHNKTVEQVMTYIGEMYSDPDLNLYRVAEKVERPEKYISNLFKEVTGMNLSDHLEQVRMDQAANLLKGDTYTVDEIAARVGYNSSHSFRRAFKRVLGVSPSSYRQSTTE
ncbi:helix-turn-helix domain-containing protein [Paenibacillus qinlingensis]|uniref:AraC-like DNA-binding protein/tetratricopeptide (TPR) repeat protein n=1 Tax=Paenibacillus qinlingensis TaxID=1837343 RepID=A0ABU1NWK9_9BACL|nr:helix-turn-helix domain-containing protein [Paenibacillus qinlingensis]MDR6551689.1 AraC-like DNA-binding protein/tetratricopeptide (TPR) repeat protein [Paenibacillus qinlingensis]